MSQQQVLIIDDEKNMRHMLQAMLTKEGYTVQSASDGGQALEYLEKSYFDFILCDIKMPNMDGMSFLKIAREKFPDKTCIMMSAYGSVETALEAMKEGAYDYISKPFKADEVLLTLKKAQERERLKQENLQLKTRINEIEKRYSFGNIVARSEAMGRVFDLASKVAEHKTTVLVTGESGTGKELIARAIHSNGPRGSGPLVTINCAGIPENLLESELFGYMKGAFTDAVKDKPGHFEKADKGTIFLDEMGELPLSLQAKLLRVLQEEEIQPLGGVDSKKIDVRVIAATSKDLNKEVQEGRFREDLFYRINVMTIHLPPLRERRGDIPLLVGYFIDIFNRKLNKNIEGLSSEAMPILMEYTWPGNVRELENVIERAILLAPGRWVTPAELMQGPAPYFGPVEALSIKKATKRMERNLIEKALKLTNGNRSQASKILEISRPILISKIKEYGLGS
ncbi:MAG: sigma-54 dependent transcriptional regulator [Desulfatiglans sp.]|jgi:two-component system response regulator AtoC|nr:sigma-54 dependent transcriptional regulator [Thermodesulfobacteriota bacterium]MEE4352772.1 sigma-54 dependent transcriptional regulator [Desulfatiglans sp.]